MAVAASLTAAGCSSSPSVPAAARPAPATAAPPPTAVPTPADPPSLDAFVPEAERFVEEHRGLRFRSPVRVLLLDDAAFRRHSGGGGIDPALAAEIDALQLVPRSVDLAAAARRSQAEGVVGLYEPPSRTLLVRGTAPTPFVRQVLVHELTHALQDQWFGIDRPQLDSGADERAQAFSALVEGDAVRIEDEYLASLPASQRVRARLEQDAATGVRGETPAPLAAIVRFPYAAGATFVRALATVRGQAGVDAAFRTPPATSAEILEPQRFLAGAAAAVHVATPAAGGPVIDRGVLGELGLRLLLEHAAATGAIRAADAEAAAGAWHGDAYVTWTSGAIACMRVALAAAHGPDHLLLQHPLAGYAARATGVSLAEAPDTLTVTSCG
ncbi:MAG: uncharacterized protein JWM18_3723 [Chloroflexi bacterium]|nr:uncharacterized protein [Chloroflexota bacterium]